MNIENEKKALLEKLEQYKKLVNTQDKSDFDKIFASSCAESNVMISPAGRYIGSEAIYNDFLIGSIRKAYSRIELISHSYDIRLLTEDSAVIMFEYSTDCDRRENGEFFSIKGLETQIYIKENGEWKLTYVHYSKG